VTRVRTTVLLTIACAIVLALLFFFLVPVTEVAFHCRDTGQLFNLCDLKKVTLFQLVFHLYPK
jgi:hypothetical protein